MKITKRQLRKIIKEELESMLNPPIDNVPDEENEVPTGKSDATNHEQRRLDALMDKIMAGLITVTPEQVDQIEKVLDPQDNQWLRSTPQKYPTATDRKI